MKTINDVFISFRQGLSELYNANETEALTLWAVSEIMEISKATIKAFPEKELTVLQQELALSILMELKTGKPLQYILGYAGFYGSRFVVNPAVLIPRPETEELVEWALDSLQWAVGGGQWAADSGQWAVGSRHEPYNILDIGTGSGCIAISLKKHLPDVNVTAIDISPEALQVAKTNALLNEVTVDFVETDILNYTTHHSLLTTHYSLIISNPPYVTPADKKQMHVNVTGFEPHTALFVPQDDPLLFYKAIADFALKHLTEKGQLFLEINESYGRETADILSVKGFKHVELRNDMSNRPRMIKAVK